MGKIKQKPVRSKRIKEPEIPSINFNKQSPLFSFEFLDESYGISQCDHIEKSGFADTLRIMGENDMGTIRFSSTSR